MTLEELNKRQSWTLNQKIDHSLGVIEQFLFKTHNQAYVSFSGGKDSTVLLDLCRIIQPNIKAVFCNTRNEYPEIVQFVRQLKNTEGYNIDIIYPELKPNEVIQKFGFPLISKHVAHQISAVRYNPNSKTSREALGIEDAGFDNTIPQRYMYLLKTSYDVSEKCCYYLKKKPFAKYHKDTGLSPILGTMACESTLRKTTYIHQGGCNVFNDKGKSWSMPLSIWMTEDVWGYIKKRKLDISPIYLEGAQRTGCMFCGFGCHMAGDKRFQICYEKYPKMYNYFMNYTNHGTTYREALQKLLSTQHKHLPDDHIMSEEDLFLLAQNIF